VKFITRLDGAGTVVEESALLKICCADQVFPFARLIPRVVPVSVRVELVAPVTYVPLACFPLSCVWIALVTPDKYPSSVAVVADVTISLFALVAKALDAVKRLELISQSSFTLNLSVSKTIASPEPPAPIFNLVPEPE